MGIYDVICIGDAKLDAFLSVSDTNDKCRFDENTKELSFKHGEKIPVEHTHFSVGGNAANVTIGLSKLGIKATIAAEIGNDEFSLKIVNTLAKANIDRGFIRQNDAESSFSVIIDYKKDRTIFSEHFKRDHNFFYESAKIKWVYLTSLGEEWAGAYLKAIDYIKNNDAKLAVNPGTLQLEEKSEIIGEVLRNTDLLLVNKEEAKELLSQYLGSNASDNIEEILSEVKKIGPKNVIITDNINGSYAMDGENKYYHEESVRCDAVELTGAGDAYASGFLAATIYDLGIQKAMSWGSFNSASVIGKIGAQDGLLNKEEMEEKINES